MAGREPGFIFCMKEEEEKDADPEIVVPGGAARLRRRALLFWEAEEPT